MKKTIKYVAILLFILLSRVAFAQNTTFTDSRDGQVYTTVRIDNKLWMANDFAYEIEEGSWFYADDEKAAQKNRLGRLYTWEAAKEACPEGWRLPTSDEYEELYIQYGTDEERLKAIGPKGKNELIFYYCGRRADLRSMGLGTNGYYWSGDIKHSLTGKSDPRTAYFLMLDKKSKWMHISSFSGNVENGFAVRYVKDL